MHCDASLRIYIMITQRSKINGIILISFFYFRLFFYYYLTTNNSDQTDSVRTLSLRSLKIFGITSIFNDERHNPLILCLIKKQVYNLYISNLYIYIYISNLYIYIYIYIYIYQICVSSTPYRLTLRCLCEHDVEINLKKIRWTHEQFHSRKRDSDLRVNLANISRQLPLPRFSY